MKPRFVYGGVWGRMGGRTRNYNNRNNDNNNYTIISTGERLKFIIRRHRWKKTGNLLHNLHKKQPVVFYLYNSWTSDCETGIKVVWKCIPIVFIFKALLLVGICYLFCWYFRKCETENSVDVVSFLQG